MELVVQYLDMKNAVLEEQERRKRTGLNIDATWEDFHKSLAKTTVALSPRRKGKTINLVLKAMMSTEMEVLIVARSTRMQIEIEQNILNTGGESIELEWRGSAERPSILFETLPDGRVKQYKIISCPRLSARGYNGDDLGRPEDLDIYVDEFYTADFLNLITSYGFRLRNAKRLTVVATMDPRSIEVELELMDFISQSDVILAIDLPLEKERYLQSHIGTSPFERRMNALSNRSWH